MNVLRSALEDMGLTLSIGKDGGLVLGGLKNLSPEEREYALAVASECKEELVGAFHERAVPAPAGKQRCIECLHWQKWPTYAWWCGLCAVTGQEVGFRSLCSVPSVEVLQ